MRTRVQDLIEQGNKLFNKRTPLLSLWQSTADQFYPERADFTRMFTLGEEFATHLMTGAPVMARRDLANQFHAMLRPRNTPWFHPRTLNETVNHDPTALKWLDFAGERMFRVMYERKAQFVRATTQGDHDFAAFGQAVIQPSENDQRNGLLYRNWHLRDTVWAENASMEIDTVHRNWKVAIRELKRLFPKTISPAVSRLVDVEPFKEIQCRHIVIPADQYDYQDAAKRPKKEFPFVSIYVDIENNVILEEVPQPSLGYVIPRWLTISSWSYGSQYAYSPATVIALADARLLQQITLTLLESGQKAVDPPMIGVGEAITGGANLGAGMITWADAEYDERLGEVLRPIMSDPKALNWGVDREERIVKAIHSAFYLDQINMPYPEKDMTASEYRGRVEEYVRRALPLFEPMETEYNGGLCSETFDILMRMNAFGPVDDIPDILRGQDIRFTFDSPLQAATERAKSQAFQDSANLLLLARQAGIQGVEFDVDWDQGFRDAVAGVGAPSDWMVDQDEANKKKAAQQQMSQMQQGVGVASQGAALAHQVGAAATQLQQAGLV